VAHFNSIQKPFVAFGYVPVADSHDLEDRTLVVSTR
jgi:hypothetical protein